MMTENDKEELLRLALAGMQGRISRPVRFQIPLATTCMIIAQLQLALRHPCNAGEGGDRLRHFIDDVIHHIEQDNLPRIGALLRCSGNPDYDEVSPT
jgi:hypothetical protein